MEDDFPFPKEYFQGLLLLVVGSVSEEIIPSLILSTMNRTRIGSGVRSRGCVGHLFVCETPGWNRVKEMREEMLFVFSTTLPTDPWSIPQTPNQQFMKEFLSFGGLGMSGVCSRGMLGFP